MLEWMRDESVVAYLNIGGAATTRDKVLKFIEGAADESSCFHRAIANYDGKYLGTVSLKNIDHEKKEAEYAIAMHMDAIGTGAAKVGTDLILEHAFNELALERVFLCVREDNQRAIKFYKKYGFIKTSAPSVGLPDDNDFLLWFEACSK